MALQIRTFYKKKDRFLENQNFCFVHERIFVQRLSVVNFMGQTFQATQLTHVKKRNERVIYSQKSLMC